MRAPLKILLFCVIFALFILFEHIGIFAARPKRSPQEQLEFETKTKNIRLQSDSNIDDAQNTRTRQRTQKPTSKSLTTTSGNKKNHSTTSTRVEPPTLEFFLKFIYPSDAERECRLLYPECARHCYIAFLRFEQFRLIEGFYSDQHQLSLPKQQQQQQQSQEDKTKKSHQYDQHLQERTTHHMTPRNNDRRPSDSPHDIGQHLAMPSISILRSNLQEQEMLRSASLHELGPAGNNNNDGEIDHEGGYFANFFEDHSSAENKNGANQIVTVRDERRGATRHSKIIQVKNANSGRDEKIMLVKIILTSEEKKYLVERGASEFQKMISYLSSRFKQVDSPSKLLSKLTDTEFALFLVTDGIFGIACAFFALSLLRLIVFKLFPWLRLNFYLKPKFVSVNNNDFYYKNGYFHSILCTKIIPVLITMTVLFCMYDQVSGYIKYNGDEKVKLTAGQAQNAEREKTEKEIAEIKKSSDKESENIIDRMRRSDLTTDDDDDKQEETCDDDDKKQKEDSGKLQKEKSSSSTKNDEEDDQSNKKSFMEKCSSLLYDLVQIEAIYLVAKALGFVILIGYVVYYRIFYVLLVAGGSLFGGSGAHNQYSALARDVEECRGDVIGAEGAKMLVAKLQKTTTPE